jgi:hypothetical protein
MNMKGTSSWLLWAALGAAGCQQAPLEAQARATAPQEVASGLPRAPDLNPLARPASATRATAALASITPQAARVPLGARLAREAAGRPALAPRLASLRAAAERRGVTLLPPRQVLASPLGARYCELASSAAGLGVALCEFGDAAQAQAGAARSHQLFDTLVPGRRLSVRDNALLTVTAAQGQRAEREAALLESAFSSLTAVPLR